MITGANGAVGTALIRHLAGISARPTRLRGLVRSLERARSIRSLPVEIVQVDYGRQDSLRGAVAGADAVVHLAGALSGGRAETLLQANAQTSRCLVEAADGAGVKTLVYLSFPTADPNSPNDYLRSKGMAEAAIRQAGFSGAIFRVPMILGPASPSLLVLRQMAAAPLAPLISGGRVRIQPISQGDLLAAIVWAISDPPGPIRVVDLVGPETLTYAELLRRVARRMGKKPRVLRIPRGLGWLSALVAGRVAPFLGWNLSIFDVLFNEHLGDPDQARALLPFTLTSVDETLDQVGLAMV